MGNCSSASSITTSIDNVAHYHHPLPSGVLLTYSLPNEQDEQPTSSEQQQQQQQQMAPSQNNNNNNESENENDNNVESNDNNNNNNDTADQDLIIQFEEMLRSLGVLDDFVRILREVPDSRSTFESFLEDFRRYLVQSNYNNNAIDMGSTPPASKAIIQNLPKITLGEDKEENNDTIQSSGEKEPCNICCECYTAEHSVTQLPCGHSFHTTCIESWLSRKCTCPICRYELPTDDQSFEVERKERMKSRSCNHHEEEQVGENHNNNNNNGTIREQSSFTGVTTCG